MVAPNQINVAIAAPGADYILIGLVAQAIADAIGAPIPGKETPLLKEGESICSGSRWLVIVELTVRSRFQSVPDARSAVRVIRAALQALHPDASIAVDFGRSKP